MLDSEVLSGQNAVYEFMLHYDYYSSLSIGDILIISQTEDTFSAWKESDSQIIATFNPSMKNAPIQVTRYGANVDISVNVQFSGDVDHTIGSGERTLEELAIKGIESWSNRYYTKEENGIVYDRFGSYDYVDVNVVVHQNSGNSVNIIIRDNINGLMDVEGTGHDIPVTRWPQNGHEWQVSNPGEIIMYTVDRRPETNHEDIYDEDELSSVIGHETGHLFGIGDVYLDKEFVDAIKKHPEISTQGWLEGDRMYYNGPVSSNDIEMLLEAWKLNKLQEFSKDNPVIRMIDNGA